MNMHDLLVMISSLCLCTKHSIHTCTHYNGKEAVAVRMNYHRCEDTMLVVNKGWFLSGQGSPKSFLSTCAADWDENAIYHNPWHHLAQR